jgi:flagellar biosynthetic protein FliP
MKYITPFLALLLALTLLPAVGLAEPLTLDLGENTAVTSRIMQMIALVTILSLAPSILMMVTSFTRIIIVLSFLRSALGLQQTPPNTVLISLALFLTAFIMAPTFEKIYNDAITPLIAEKITERQALDRTIIPVRTFMLKHTRDKDIGLFVEMAKLPQLKNRDDTPLQVLLPAFMISELRRAFEIGFLIFIPFLVIDMLVSSILMAMGMMMLPPVMISLPFKLIFFVIIDGWYMICGSLIRSFN